MTAFIAITGALALRLGLCTAVSEDGSVSLVSPGLAGCGASAIFALIVGGMLS